MLCSLCFMLQAEVSLFATSVEKMAEQQGDFLKKDPLCRYYKGL